MKRVLQSMFLLLAILVVPSNANADYVQLAEGVYQDGTTLYIVSSVASLGDLQVNPSEIYCYATIPPACVSNTFTGYDATLHVPAAGMVSYFTTLYWYNFNNILSDAIEPQSVTMNSAEAEMEIGQQLSLSATVAPSDATPKTVYWSSSDASVATISRGGTVTAVATGECDILATCIDKVAVCHVTVVNPRVTITLDKHEASLLPNHTMTLTATCSPIDVDLAVTSSNPGVAIPRLVNGTIMVVGVAEGTATITVNAADGLGNPDSCVVTVYTELGDVDCDGYVGISDVSVLIDFLLNGDPDGLSEDNADTDKDGYVSISDVSTLIDYLLNGRWPWQQDMTFTVNGVSFTMVYVDGGTFTMGATPEQSNDAEENEKPSHQVTLSPFTVGQTEVTQALWQAVMNSNPSHTSNPNFPVDNISWNDCQLFISKLNALTGQKFRLLTEAEWEYTARGGNKSQGYKYSGSNDIDDVAWWDGNACNGVGTNNPNYGPHAVGTKMANELGIYDMSGNVIEWCQDWRGIYSDDPQTDPVGPSFGTDRLHRGGCWANEESICRVSSRSCDEPAYAYYIFGMRLALDIEQTTKLRLSESVVEVMLDESKEVSIINGSGDYSIEGGTDRVSCEVNGNSLTITGQALGVTTLYVTDSITNTKVLLNIIVKENKKEFTVNGVSFSMIFVEGGTFTMCYVDENTYSDTPHEVTLSDFYIGQVEVTQELWDAVASPNPSHFTGDQNRPVECVTYDQAHLFVAGLSSLTGYSFRLPTESQWEYAARGGNKSGGYGFAGSNNLNDIAWNISNSSNTTHPVATKKPNELGIYDMSGNVFEWCDGWYEEYSGEAQTDPPAPSSGKWRVSRGGSYDSESEHCNVLARNISWPGAGFSNNGLRIILTVSQ